MKVIVLGGTGFIGSGVAEVLASKGHKVTIGTRNDNGSIDRDLYSIKEIDYSSIGEIEKSVVGHDFVINCIANIHGEDISIDAFRKVEVNLTEVIAKSCLDKNIPLIQLSSTIAFGRKIPDIPIDENFMGNEFEMIDKVCIEREEIIRDVFKKSDNFVILRPVSLIGAKDKGGILRKIFDSYLKGNFPIVEGGLAKISLADRRDFGNAIEAAIYKFEEIKGNMFIVSGFNVKWMEIKEAFDSYYGKKHEYMPLTRYEAEVRFGNTLANFLGNNRLFNDKKFREKTGFLPLYTLNDAIESYLSI